MRYDTDFFARSVESFLSVLDLLDVTLGGVSIGGASIGGAVSLIIAGRRNPWRAQTLETRSCVSVVPRSTGSRSGARPDGAADLARPADEVIE